jgi:hypothetical protein
VVAHCEKNINEEERKERKDYAEMKLKGKEKMPRSHKSYLTPDTGWVVKGGRQISFSRLFMTDTIPMAYFFMHGKIFTTKPLVLKRTAWCTKLCYIV